MNIIEYCTVNAFWGLCFGFLAVVFMGLFIEAKKENKELMRDFLILPFIFAICAGIASSPFYHKNKNLAKMWKPRVERFHKYDKAE